MGNQLEMVSIGQQTDQLIVKHLSQPKLISLNKEAHGWTQEGVHLVNELLRDVMLQTREEEILLIALKEVFAALVVEKAKSKTNDKDTHEKQSTHLNLRVS